MSENSLRNQRILSLVATQRLSYEVIAEMIGCSRNVVAGVAFRDRHPLLKRIPSPKYVRNKATGRGGGGNKTGTGYQPPTYWPELTAANTR